MTYFESSLVDLLKRARWHTMDALVSILKIIFLNSSGRSTALIIILLVGVAVVTFFLLFIKDTSKKNATPDQTSLDHRLVTKQSFDTSVDLIPLKIGMYWEYEVTNGESKSIDRHEIYYEETINGQKWFEGGSYFFDGEYVRNSKDGVHVLVYCDYDPLPECDGDEEKSIDKILFNKTLNQGDTYQYSEATITFQGQRKVTVPAGEYIYV